ncbi:hypothetical protein AOC05_01065 [Arthrobacter alpinus]|uniref:Uncharacterized protein n=1 Tax=Arthrobacter alpinus TaxID=656366 RepID=A0A0M4RME6_9MICC|nr:hypothetical protein AOC05_01065 [Arthrobacter alpinus]
MAALGNEFLEALQLCQAAGMASVGKIALDRTKIRANASPHEAMSYDRLTAKQKVLAEEKSRKCNGSYINSGVRQLLRRPSVSPLRSGTPPTRMRGS